MAVQVQTTLDQRIAKYVEHVKAQRQTTDTDVVQELIEQGYDEVLRQFHRRYQRGELTFRTVSSELGLSVRELYELFKQKGLPT